MKKLLLALSTTALIFGLGACGGKKSTSTSTSSSGTSGTSSQTSQTSQTSSQPGASSSETTPTNLIYLNLGPLTGNWDAKEEYGGYIRAYLWGGSETMAWPGVKMTLVSTGVYSVENANSAVNIIFHVNNDAGEWDGDIKTVDLTIPSGENPLFTINTNNVGSKQEGTWSTYAA